MVVVRILVLAFLVYYGWVMGHVPPNQLNAFGTLAAYSFFVTAPLLYFLPALEARFKKHPNLVAIELVNIFLGWTLVGWVCALAWAYKTPEAAATAPASSEPQTKACPYCAEDVRVEAIKCKHCGSALPA